MNKTEKTKEAKVQLNNRAHFKPLKARIVKNTWERVNEIIDQMHRGKHIDGLEMAFTNSQYPPSDTQLAIAENYFY